MLLAVLVTLAQIDEANKCEKRGGVYVKGVYGYVCVKGQ